MTPGIFHRRFDWPMFWGAVALALLAGFILGGCFGCASIGKKAPASQPVTQVGAVNKVSDDDNAGGIVAYRSELGIGAIILLALSFGVRPWLSHRRKVLAMKLAATPAGREWNGGAP